MKIQSELTHWVAQTTAAISRAIWEEIDLSHTESLDAAIVGLEVSDSVLEKEIKKWGKDLQPFTVVADVNVFDYQDDDRETYEYDHWSGLEYQITLTYTPTYAPAAGFIPYSATAVRIEGRGPLAP